MSKRRRKQDDPFGVGTLSKRLTLSTNQMRGRIAEDGFALSQRAQGHEIKRTPVGCDFVVQRRDIFGRKIGKPETHEIKTGGSPLSAAQRKKKRQLKRNYIVDRYP